MMTKLGWPILAKFHHFWHLEKKLIFGPHHIHLRVQHPMCLVESSFLQNCLASYASGFWQNCILAKSGHCETQICKKKKEARWDGIGGYCMPEGFHVVPFSTHMHVPLFASACLAKPRQGIRYGWHGMAWHALGWRACALSSDVACRRQRTPKLFHRLCPYFLMESCLGQSKGIVQKKKVGSARPNFEKKRHVWFGVIAHLRGFQCRSFLHTHTHTHTRALSSACLAKGRQGKARQGKARQGKASTVWHGLVWSVCTLPSDGSC